MIVEIANASCSNPGNDETELYNQVTYLKKAVTSKNFTHNLITCLLDQHFLRNYKKLY